MAVEAYDYENDTLGGVLVQHPHPSSHGLSLRSRRPLQVQVLSTPRRSYSSPFHTHTLNLHGLSDWELLFPFVFFLRSIVSVVWRVEFFKISALCSLLFTECAFYATDTVEIHVVLYPLEIQALFYTALRCAHEVLTVNDGTKSLVAAINNRLSALSFHVRDYYWVDMKKINEIYRYHTKESSQDAVNKFNIYRDQIPSWLVDWMPEEGGYLIGNLQPAHMDFRFFTLGIFGPFFPP